MMFYNGFNLLIDIMLCAVTALIFYRAGFRDGWIRGYGEGEADYREWSQDFEQYVADQQRENAD